MCKKIAKKIAIFWIMDAHEGYRTAFRLLEMGQYSYGTPILIYRVSNVYLSYIYRVSTVVDSGQIADRSRTDRGQIEDK